MKVRKKLVNWYKCVHCGEVSENGTWVGICFKPKDEGFVDMRMWDNWSKNGFPHDISLHDWELVGKGVDIEDAETRRTLKDMVALARD